MADAQDMNEMDVRRLRWGMRTTNCGGMGFLGHVLSLEFPRCNFIPPKALGSKHVVLLEAFSLFLISLLIIFQTNFHIRTILSHYTNYYYFLAYTLLIRPFPDL